jgi:hypothetical protein
MALPFTIKARFRLTMKAVPFTLKAFRLTMKAVPFTLKAFRLTKKAVPWVTLTALMARLTLTALRCLTMKAVPFTLKALRLTMSLIHSRFRSAAAVALSRFAATSMLFISLARSRLSLSPLATLSLHVAAERFLAHSGLSE